MYRISWEGRTVKNLCLDIDRPDCFSRLLNLDIVIDESINLEDGTDAYARAGIRIGDSTAWEYDLFVEKTKIASVYTDPETGSTKYLLSDETNNKIGLKVINHFGENFSFNFGLANDDFSGSSFSLGLRYSF